jgi:branched-chain amino acid transport system substrate-binding protein
VAAVGLIQLRLRHVPFYVDEVRAGINYFVAQKGKKAICAMYQDTDFGKEVLDGAQMQVDALKLKLVETTTHKPTDQDFTAQITKLKSAGCDLVVLGTIVRDSIVPYAAARKMGWTDVDFLGSASAYDLFVAAAQGGVTEGLYAMGLTDMPYRDTLGPSAQSWFDHYKERFKAEPNIGAVYGYVRERRSFPRLAPAAAKANAELGAGGKQIPFARQPL